MTSRKGALIFTIAAACFGLVLTALLAQRAERSRGAQAAFDNLPVLGKVPDFALTDTNGETFTANELDNTVWVADFIFTSCAGPCPVMSSKMARLQQQFDDEDVAFVSVTVDPDRDTPEVLAKYGKEYGADLTQWHFLTGDIDAIHELSVKGFMVGSVDEPVFHSTRFILVDGNRQIRGYYRGAEEADVAELARDIRSLLADAQA